MMIIKDLAWNVGAMVDKNDLIKIYDNYGIFYKRVCPCCHDEVEDRIRGNNYGDELSHDELYGEDYL
jgi:hypothetical protein